MLLLQFAALFLVVYKGECVRADICSKHGLLPGIAGDRDTLSKGKSLILYDVDPPTCDDGIRCKRMCLNTTFGWNYVEVRVVSHCSALLSN